MRKSALYTIVNSAGTNAIDAFERDPDSGKLTYMGRYQTGGKGDPQVGGVQSHAIVADKGHLYAVNPGDGTISSFAIGKDGTLKLLNTVSSGGMAPGSLAISGQILYVANQGAPPGTMPARPASYSGFRIHHDGTLAPIPGSTIALKDGDSPGEILFNHNGKRLIACRLGGNLIDVFDVNGEGCLVNAGSLNQPGPFGAVFNPVLHDKLMVCLANPEAGPPGVVAVSLSDHGAPSVINAVINPAQMDPCWLAVAGNGKWLWASAFIPMDLTLYSVGANGSLTEAGKNNPTPGPNGSTDIVLDSSDRFMYRLRVFDVATVGQVPRVPIIEVFKVTGHTANGGLELVQALSLDYDPGLTESGIMGLAVVNL